MSRFRQATAAAFLATFAGAFIAASALAGPTPKTHRADDVAKPVAPDPLAAARVAAGGDVLLESLLTELDRSRLQLKMDQVAAPYYIEYRVNDVSEFQAEAAFGALRENQRVHYRVLRVVVRIGDYKQDSFYNQGMGETTILPLEDDPISIRHQIWLATDAAYKSAGEASPKKLPALKQFGAESNPVDDFAKAPVVSAVEPTVKLDADSPAWKKTLEDVTNLYRQYPDVQSVSASARFSAINEYLVNSEGTITRSGRKNYYLQFNSSAQAPDGMRVTRNPFWMVAKFEELPTHDALIADARKALDTLVALRQAPMVEEEYRGPVLFAPDAADDIIASLIGTNVLGRKPQLGRPNRTTGAFATSYKTRVLPAFLTVIDD